MPNINLIAVLAAGVAGMAVGALWYSRLLFGKQWAKLMGYTAEKIEEIKKRGVAKVYTIAFLTELVTAYVLAYLIALTGSYSFAVLVPLVLWIWVGFPVPLLIGSVLWEDKPVSLIAINAVHNLVTLMVMGLVLIALA